MSRMKFTEVERLPYFQTSNIDGVLRGFYRKQRTDLFATLMPLKNINADKIEMDIDKANIGGMTPVVAIGAESPLFKTGGRGKISWEPAEFREKVRVTEDELVDLRKLGTMNELMTAMELLGGRYSMISERLARRLEWMRRQVLFDGAVTAHDPNGTVNNLLSVKHPDFMQQTASNLWTDTTNADPLNDMQIMVRDFMLYSGYEAARVWAPHDALRIASQTAKFQLYASNNFSVFQAMPDQVGKLITQFIGGVSVEEQPQTMPFQTSILADAASGQPVIYLNDVTELAPGDRIVLVHADQDQKLHTVDTISGNEITLTSNLTKAFPVGSMAVYHKFLIPKDRLLVLGKPQTPVDPAGAEPNATMSSDLLTQPFDVGTTLSGYVDMNARKPGLFTKLFNHLDGDPPYVEQAVGIRALPRVHYVNAWLTFKFQA
jgi:hypothetical protein